MIPWLRRHNITLDEIRLGCYGLWLLAWALIHRLSDRWLTRKRSELLAKALGRSLRPGEEDSLKAWLQLPQAQLDEVNQQLAENPFNGIAERLDEGLAGPADDVVEPKVAGVPGEKTQLNGGY